MNAVSPALQYLFDALDRWDIADAILSAIPTASAQDLSLAASRVVFTALVESGVPCTPMVADSVIVGAAEAMQGGRKAGLVILDQDGKAVGIISRRHYPLVAGRLLIDPLPVYEIVTCFEDAAPPPEFAFDLARELGPSFYGEIDEGDSVVKYEISYGAEVPLESFYRFHIDTASAPINNPLWKDRRLRPLINHLRHLMAEEKGCARDETDPIDRHGEHATIQ